MALSTLTYYFISSSWQPNCLHFTDEETGIEKLSNFPKIWLQSLFSSPPHRQCGRERKAKDWGWQNTNFWPFHLLAVVLCQVITFLWACFPSSEMEIPNPPSDNWEDFRNDLFNSPEHSKLFWVGKEIELHVFYDPFQCIWVELVSWEFTHIKQSYKFRRMWKQPLVILSLPSSTTLFFL